MCEVRFRIKAFFVLTVLVLLPSSYATVSFSRIYNNSMVLQQQMPVSVTGFADAGEQVNVTFVSPNNPIQTKQAIANADGYWVLKLDALTKDTAAGTLSVQGTSNTVTLNDVLVGEVWIFTGQSNMDWFLSSLANLSDPIQNSDALAAYAEADNPATRPLIRLFHPSSNNSIYPQVDFWAGEWKENTKANLEAGISATGYFCCQELAKQLPDTPIGLLDMNKGGSHIQAWISRDAALQIPALADYTHIMATSNSFQNISSISDSSRPSEYYNKMIAPLTTFTMRGTLWCQGESSSNDGRWHYAKQLPTLIDNWRTAWDQNQFHFGIIQVFTSEEFNAAQANTARYMKDCSYIDISDVDPDGTHYWNKKPVGDRSAWWMLNTVYGEIAFPETGPVYKSHTINGNEITITFDHVGAGGLKSSDGQAIRQFSISSSLTSSSWATCDSVTIQNGNQVVVSASSVSAPMAVRYSSKGGTPGANLTSSDDWNVASFVTSNLVSPYLHNPEGDPELDCTLLWPLNGKSFASGSTLAIQGMANYDAYNKTVDSLELYVNGQLQATMDYKNNRFYEYALSPSDGYHTLKVRAISGTENNESEETLIYVGSNPEYYQLDINSGFATGKYLKGQKIGVYSSTINLGIPFDQWVGDTAVLDDANSDFAVVTMPANDVKLTASFTSGSTHTITESAE